MYYTCHNETTIEAAIRETEIPVEYTRMSPRSNSPILKWPTFDRKVVAKY